MKRNRVLYVAGFVLGLGGILMLVPQVRDLLRKSAGTLSERAGQAWEEGKKAKRRREQELEQEVLGVSEPGEAERETPDYIV